MVKLWFVYDCCHDPIKNMFFTVGNRQYQKFSRIAHLLVKGQKSRFLRRG